MARAILLFAVVLVALLGCATAPEPAEEPAQELPEPTPGTTPPEPPPPEPPAEPEPEPEDAETFEVTQEVYDRTFEEVQEVITRLNDVIQREDYDTWLSYLTEEYIAKTSRQEYLDRWKDDPFLQRKNVTLNSLRDFFDHLVVPTRSNVRLDEIEFVDATDVYAYTVYKGEKYVLYHLVKTDEGWKVDFY